MRTGAAAAGVARRPNDAAKLKEAAMRPYRRVRMTGPMILLDDVHLKLASAAGPVNVLRGVSLEVEPGETVSVVGPSGSGKSTMMMVIGGLERPTAGRVVVAGHELGGMGEDALARFRRDTIGIVFQA